VITGKKISWGKTASSGALILAFLFVFSVWQTEWDFLLASVLVAIGLAGIFDFPFLAATSIIYMLVANLASAYVPKMLIPTTPFGSNLISVGLIILPLILLSGYLGIQHPPKTPRAGGRQNHHLVFVWMVGATLGTYAPMNKYLFVASFFVVCAILLSLVWEVSEQQPKTAANLALGGLLCYILVGLVFFTGNAWLNQWLGVAFTVTTIATLLGRGLYYRFFYRV